MQNTWPISVALRNGSCDWFVKSHSERASRITNHASTTMYRKILVALENSPADKSLLPHVTELARRLQSQLLLVHVADGWVARNFDKLKLAESDEMKADRAYLEQVAAQLRAGGITARTCLALGDPPEE